jgi:hypothetical protein
MLGSAILAYLAPAQGTLATPSPERAPRSVSGSRIAGSRVAGSRIAESSLATAERTPRLGAVPASPWPGFDPWRAPSIPQPPARPARLAAPAASLPRDELDASEEPERGSTLLRAGKVDAEAIRKAGWEAFVGRDRNSFSEQFGRTFADRFAPIENRNFRAAMELSWTLPSHPEDPAREYAPLGASDPIYRDFLLERRGRSPISKTTTDALTETEVFQEIRRELNDRKDPLSVGARTVLGEPTEGAAPFGVGRVGFRGYATNYSRPGDLLGVTYELGPFDARVGGASTTTRVGQQIGTIRASAGMNFKYNEQQARPLLQLTRPLGRLTSLHLFAGYAADSFILPGNVPYFEDPREENRSVGVVFLFDTRF